MSFIKESKNAYKQVQENHIAIAMGKMLDDEGSMVLNQLEELERAIKMIRDYIGADYEKQLPAWVQSKVTLGSDYISTVGNYLSSKNEKVTEQAIKEEFDLEETSLAAIHKMKEDGKTTEEIAKELKLNAGLVKKILGEEVELKEFTDAMLAALKKEYDPLKGKTITTSQYQQLKNILIKLQDGDLEKLQKQNIPFASTGAGSILRVRKSPVKITNIKVPGLEGMAESELNESLPIDDKGNFRDKFKQVYYLKDPKTGEIDHATISGNSEADITKNWSKEKFSKKSWQIIKKSSIFPITKKIEYEKFKTTKEEAELQEKPKVKKQKDQTNTIDQNIEPSNAGGANTQIGLSMGEETLPVMSGSDSLGYNVKYKVKKEVKLTEDSLEDLYKKLGWNSNNKTYGVTLTHPKHGVIEVDRYGEWHHKPKNISSISTVAYKPLAFGKNNDLSKYISSLKEEVELKPVPSEDIKESIIHTIKNILLEKKAAEDAKKQGLEYYGFGRYGKNKTVTHKSVNGNLKQLPKDQQTKVDDKDTKKEPEDKSKDQQTKTKDQQTKSKDKESKPEKVDLVKDLKNTADQVGFDDLNINDDEKNIYFTREFDPTLYDEDDVKDEYNNIVKMLNKKGIKYKPNFDQDVEINDDEEFMQIDFGVPKDQQTESLKETKEPTGELKDACWPGYTAVGFKMEKLPVKDIEEASSFAQQAAIAIAKKKSGKYDKDGKRIKYEGAKALVETITALQKKADKSGMPYSILKQVYDRGMAAWKGGHRPGAEQHQWAFARVNSFVTKSSGTWGGADSDLAKKVKGKE